MNLLTRSRTYILVLGGLILVGCAARQGEAVDDAKISAKTQGKPNRLVRETSPYLLLHAHNPVDWYPWGPEAFEKARKEGKMIFLSVGYSSCYWCHVMERKVFMNDAIAKILNENFVCIKVDREERPDVDDVYMTALQVYYAATGSSSSGGWPLSMFMTPDAKPFAGGTYFPPEDMEGAPGFPSVLERLIGLWRDQRKQLEGNADIIAGETRRVMRPKLTLKPVEANAALVQKSFDAVVASIDPEFGGVDFNSQRPAGPKFPTPSKLIFVQEILKRQPNADAAALLDLTLMQMACGGVRDHVGGGFHRYSVDRKWQVPHFEKMLYDQAQLVDLYASAYAITQNKLYRQVAEETLEFVERELMSNEGAFYSALDAETNGVEGEYYVWEARDLDKILGQDAAAFKEAYHVKDLSDFEHGNVLRLSPKQLPGPARDISLGAKNSADTDEFSTSRRKLLEVRNQRPKLLRDEKILVGWNGLMIGAFARAGMLLDQPDFVRTAEKAAIFLMTNVRDQQGRLMHTYTAGQSRLNAYLDDYAFVIDGLLALHEATSEAKWLRAARQLQDDQLKMFRDEVGGAFFFTSHDHEELLARTKNCYDGVLPAGNSVSARNLLKLARLTSDKKYATEARTIIELFASNLDQSPRGLNVLALATSELLAESPEGETKAKGETMVAQAGGTVETPPRATVTPVANQKEEPPKKDEHVKAQAYLSVDKLPAGSACQVVVVMTVAKGWHVNANPPKPDYLKPVKISWKSKNGIELTDVKYPQGMAFKFDDADDEAMVYEGEVQVRGTLKIPKDAGGLTEDMELTVNYQACNKDGCLPPKTIKLTGKLQIAKPGEAVKSINGKLFNSKPDPGR